MYLLYKDGSVQRFPYSVADLRSENPQVSFPEITTDNFLAEWGVYPYSAVPAPSITYRQNIAEGTPVQINGVWTQVWLVTDASADEIASRISDQWQSVRSQRNELLSSCDWTQLPDTPVNAEPWAVYRQQLRDVTKQADPFNIDWPLPPS